jgi:hypothetical protein
VSAAPYWVTNLIPIGNPLKAPNLEFGLVAGVSTAWQDFAGTVPAVPGGLIRRYNDVTSRHQDTVTTGPIRPTWGAGFTPHGNPAVQFGFGGLTNNQLGWVPGVNRFITNARGYTIYIWYLNGFTDHGAKPGQSVFDVTLGSGFRYQHQAPGAPDTSNVVYLPGTAAIIVPDQGVWELWTIVAAAPQGAGAMRIYKDETRVGPTAVDYGPPVDTLWAMSIEDRFLISGNPVNNIPFFGDFGAVLLYSDTHSQQTAKAVRSWIRTHV